MDITGSIMDVMGAAIASLEIKFKFQIGHKHYRLVTGFVTGVMKTMIASST